MSRRWWEWTCPFCGEVVARSSVVVSQHLTEQHCATFDRLVEFPAWDEGKEMWRCACGAGGLNIGTIQTDHLALVHGAQGKGNTQTVDPPKWVTVEVRHE